MTQTMKETVEQAANLIGVHPTELNGNTYRSVLEDCETYGGVTISWGCWNDQELNTIINY